MIINIHSYGNSIIVIRAKVVLVFKNVLEEIVITNILDFESTNEYFGLPVHFFKIIR